LQGFFTYWRAKVINAALATTVYGGRLPRLSIKLITYNLCMYEINALYSGDLRDLFNVQYLRSCSTHLKVHNSHADHELAVITDRVALLER